MTRTFLVVLVILLVCLLAFIYVSRGKETLPRLAEREGAMTTLESLLSEDAPLLLLGAAEKGRPPGGQENLIVDTLNLTHWLRPRAPRIAICDVIAAIDETAAPLRARFPGRVIYVTKERESGRREKAERERALFQAAARRNKVYIDVVERLPSDVADKQRPHAALGRDDFYLIMLAWKYRSGVLSRDRFRDLSEMKTGALPPFHVFKFSPHKDLAERDFVNPAAAEFARMGRPKTYDYEDVLPRMRFRPRAPPSMAQ